MTLPIADISTWQGAINYPLLMSKTSGVIIRAGTGIQEDLRFEQNYDGLKSHPGILGAYWFVWSHINGAHQAEAFHAVLSEYGDFPDFLVMDAEENGAGLSQSALRARYRLFLDTLADLRPNDEVRIYTRASFWNPNIGVAGWEPGYKLWVAHYGVEVPAVPTAWAGDWWLHQFSADGNNLGAEYGVSSDDIDLNKVNPVYIPPDPDPDPDPVPCVPLPRLRVLTNNLSIRSTPFVPAWPNTYEAPPNGNLVGKLAAGTIVEAQDITIENADRVWVRHTTNGVTGWSAVVYGTAQHMVGV